MAADELERSLPQDEVIPSARSLIEKTPPQSLEIAVIQPLIDDYQQTMGWLKKHRGRYTFQVEVEDEGQTRLEDAVAIIGAGVLIRRLSQPPEENEFNFGTQGDSTYVTAVQRVYFTELPEVTMRGKARIKEGICTLANLGYLQDGLHTLKDIRNRIEFPPTTVTFTTP